MNNIRVGCSVLIKSNNKLLLGIRNKELNKGMIITPGGGVELFERMEDTVKREIMEKTGLEITNIKQLKTYAIINKPDEHRIIIYWSADYDKNSVQSATDLVDAKFYSNFVKNISFNFLNSKRNWRGLKIMFFQIVIKRYYVNISNYFIFIS